MLDLLISLGVPRSSAGDVWLLILFVVASLVLIALVKRRNLGSLLFSVYIAFAIVAKTKVPFLSAPNAKFIYFAVLLILVFTLFRRLFRMGITGKKILVWVKTTLFSLSVVGLLVSIVLNWYSRTQLDEFFSGVSLGLFRSDEAQLLWMIIPLLIVLIFKYRQ